jgi:D-glycero-alpha-D-manno-heptose 1-phosphate guanylyltransferase
MPSHKWIIVANGDSLTPFNLNSMLAQVRNGLDGAIIGVHASDSERFGSLISDGSGILTGFREKEQSAVPCFVNGGVYLLKSSLFKNATPEKPGSLESEYFPKWLSEGIRIRVLKTQNPFIDIGTPESLSQAAYFLRNSGFSKLI